MISKKNNNRVVIVSKHYLIKLGAQALIKHIGIEPNYELFNDIDEVQFKSYNSEDALIVHHQALAIPKDRYLKQLEELFSGKIMVIGNSKMGEDFYQHIILPTDSQALTIEKFQNFFAGNNEDETADENNLLSAREIDILKEVAQGYANKEIAERLFISINTVITHRKNLTEKLGIKTISGLTVYALMNNLINPEDVTM